MKFKQLHADKRGKIFLLEEDLGYPEFTIFITRKGLARGGCIHKKSDEYTCIISGVVVYTLGDKVRRMSTGDSMLIPRGTPHYFVSVTDSVVAEWGATPKEKKQKYAKFRKIVYGINDRSNTPDI